MKKLIKITAVFILIWIVQISAVFAQQTTQAVMQVRAQVVSAVQLQDKITRDFSFDLNTVKDKKLTVNETHVDIGHYTIRIPDGTEFTMNVEKSVTMGNGKYHFSMDTSTKEYMITDGTVTIEVSGTIDLDKVEAGTYSGTQTTRIEYH